MLELLQGMIMHNSGNDRSDYEGTKMGMIGTICGHDWNQLEQPVGRIGTICGHDLLA